MFTQNFADAAFYTEDTHVHTTFGKDWPSSSSEEEVNTMKANHSNIHILR